LSGHELAALLYTPDREHFGIVPLEAMGVGLPVIAMASGGPLESVRHNRSGFLCTEQTGAAFARFMAHFIRDDTRSKTQQADGDGDGDGDDTAGARGTLAFASPPQCTRR
jgi:glycosyltransferase involved in cell wall biosynthesis